MSEASQIDLAIVLSRSLVLTIAALAGTLSIFLGYRLYLRGVESSVSGSVERAKISAKLSAAGPGIFFALFGMGILIYLVLHSAEIETTVGPSSSPASYLAPATDGLRLIRLSAANPTPQPPPQCLVYRRKLRFGNGEQITQDEVGKALRRAEACLVSLSVQSMSLAEADEVNRSITVLHDMSGSLDPPNASPP